MTYREKKYNILTFIQIISKIPFVAKSIDNFGYNSDYEKRNEISLELIYQLR